MPLPLDRRPLYIQAYDRLHTLIQEGDLEPGDQLPSEHQLADQLGISRATLREALRLLEEEGAILRRQGVGTFVAPEQHLESGLERLESVQSLATRQGMDAQVKGLSVEVVPANQALVDRLEVEQSAPLTRVRRTILVEKRPVAYLEDIVPTTWLTPDDLEGGFEGSVLDLLRRRRTPRIYEARAEIIPVPADPSLAQRLGVPVGTPLLLLEETLFDVEQNRIGFSRNYFVPDRFRFHVIRRSF